MKRFDGKSVLLTSKSASDWQQIFEQNFKF